MRALTQCDAVLERTLLAHAEASPALSPDSAFPLAAQLVDAHALLSAGLVERDTEARGCELSLGDTPHTVFSQVRLLLLAMLAGEHLLLLGRPGTAKSEVGRRLGCVLLLCDSPLLWVSLFSCAFRLLVSGRYFERLLTRFSVPEELFGPLSLRGLEQSEYVRKTDGFLPTADVAFVDEIFKANSSILNALLTLLNERAFDNGSSRVSVPLRCLVAASNELPESEELDALYDRFILRRQVAQVSSAGLAQLLSARPAQPMGGGGSARFSSQELQSVRDAARHTTVPPPVHQLLCDLRAWLQRGGTYVSDRRFTRAVRLLQVAAHAAGSSQVRLHDCLLLEHVMWARPEQAAPLRDWLLARVAPGEDAQACSERYDAQLNVAFREVRPHSHRALTSTAQLTALPHVCPQLCCIACSDTGDADAALRLQLASLHAALHASAQDAAAASLCATPASLRSPWMCDAEIAALAQVLARAAAAQQAASLVLLHEVLTIESALAAHAPPHAVALLLPARWLLLTKAAREEALSSEGRLRVAIPPCGHRIGRSFCYECLRGMGLTPREAPRVLPRAPDPRL